MDSVTAIAAVDEWVHNALVYRAGVTDVGVDVRSVYEAAEGVCQDYAHLPIAMYRALGVPACYVSGYIYASDLTGGTAPEQAEVEIQTHAWVEAFIPGFGWWGLDPTNPQDVDERHVKIGHGRGYDDVMPLRGIYHGPAEHALGVSVQISQEGLSTLQKQQQVQQ